MVGKSVILHDIRLNTRPNEGLERVLYQFIPTF